jgi:hypothetical protein
MEPVSPSTPADANKKGTDFLFSNEVYHRVREDNQGDNFVLCDKTGLKLTKATHTESEDILCSLQGGQLVVRCISHSAQPDTDEALQTYFPFSPLPIDNQESKGEAEGMDSLCRNGSHLEGTQASSGSREPFPSPNIGSGNGLDMEPVSPSQTQTVSNPMVVGILCSHEASFPARNNNNDPKPTPPTQNIFIDSKPMSKSSHSIEETQTVSNPSAACFPVSISHSEVETRMDAIPIAEGATNLPMAKNGPRLLEVREVAQHLINCANISELPNRIPIGKKENVLFILNDQVKRACAARFPLPCTTVIFIQGTISSLSPTDVFLIIQNK